jgi:hypothetical protein
MSNGDVVDIYDYLNGAENATDAFRTTLQGSDRARLDAKIAVIRTNGFVLLGSHVLTNTRSHHIKEIRVNGRVAVRLLSCRGPIGADELTLLFGAFEENRRYVPRNALSIAQERREAVIDDPIHRRVISITTLSYS